MKQYGILLVVFLLALGCSFAAAEETDSVVYTCGDFRYILQADGTAEIIGYTGNENELTVPDTLGGYPVAAIGEDAFYSCNSLISVALPEGIVRIGNLAFESCERLTSIILPDSVTEMGFNPFRSCEKLTEIRVSPDQPVFATIDGVLFHKAEKKLICYPCAFTATEYQVPKGIRSIGISAFYGCQNLIKITLPEGITQIENGGFSTCSNLTGINLPEGLESIGGGAFYYCTNLTDIVLPEGLSSIGDFAFSDCYKLTNITLPKELASIGEFVFSNCINLTNNILPEELTSIGDNAFSGCSSLTSITLPEGLISIGGTAFSGCSSLKGIILPDCLTQMDSNPFSDCKKLTVILVSPDHPVFAIVDGVLFNKAEKKLICYPCAFTATEYQVPEGIRSIGNYAFSNCNALTSVTLPDSVTSIGERAFSECPEDLLFTVVRDSYGAQWCKENGKNYTYTDALDWLND